MDRKVRDHLERDSTGCLLFAFFGLVVVCIHLWVFVDCIFLISCWLFGVFSPYTYIFPLLFSSLSFLSYLFSFSQYHFYTLFSPLILFSLVVTFTWGYWYHDYMKNDIAAIKNSIKSIISRLEEAKDHISELEDKVGKIPK